MVSSMRIRRSPAEQTYTILIYAALVVAMIVTLYPFLFVLSMSISNPDEVIRGRVWLFPRGLSLKSYDVLFRDRNLRCEKQRFARTRDRQHVAVRIDKVRRKAIATG